MSAPSPHLTDRAIGAVLGSAAGDALGAPYEFKPSLPDDAPVVLKAGGPWELGEWTDDTSMAVPILQALARGERLDDAAVLGGIVAEWQRWARTAKDVGIQTRQVLGRLPEPVDGSRERIEPLARAAARAVHDATGKSAGNGTLMRTGPVALGYLDDGREVALATSARRLSDLTHYETDAGDACVIWSLAIRHAIRTGEYDIRGPIDSLPAERRARWHELIDVAERTQPRDIPGSNGWVVAALQAAWSAIQHGNGFADSVERAVRCGNDTDTVAAIAGALIGARWGVSAIPFAWRRHLHGWPGLGASDLAALAVRASKGGRVTDASWPLIDRMTWPTYRPAVRHPHDADVWLGDLRGLDHLPDGADAVVSLCRVGTSQVEVLRHNHNVVWIIDEDGANANLDLTLADAADSVAALRAEGRTVYLHCVAAESRTPSVAAAYSVRHLGRSAVDALGAVIAAMPAARPAKFLVEAVRRLEPAAHPIVADQDAVAYSRKPILYIDLDNTLVDFRSALSKLTPPRHADEEDLDDIPGIFALMDPMPGAIEAFHALAAEYDTYILSTAPWKNPSAWSDKLEWVQRHFGTGEGTPAYKRLILSHHKDLNRGEYLVDDRPHNGAAEFEGAWLHFGADGEYETWADITAYLLGPAKEKGPAEAA